MGGAGATYVARVDGSSLSPGDDYLFMAAVLSSDAAGSPPRPLVNALRLPPMGAVSVDVAAAVALASPYLLTLGADNAVSVTVSGVGIGGVANVQLRLSVNGQPSVLYAASGCCQLDAVVVFDPLVVFPEDLVVLTANALDATGAVLARRKVSIVGLLAIKALFWY